MDRILRTKIWSIKEKGFFSPFEWRYATLIKLDDLTCISPMFGMSHKDRFLRTGQWPWRGKVIQTTPASGIRSLERIDRNWMDWGRPSLYWSPQLSTLQDFDHMMTSSGELNVHLAKWSRICIVRCAVMTDNELIYPIKKRMHHWCTMYIHIACSDLLSSLDIQTWSSVRWIPGLLQG